MADDELNIQRISFKSSTPRQPPTSDIFLAELRWLADQKLGDIDGGEPRSDEERAADAEIAELIGQQEKLIERFKAACLRRGELEAARLNRRAEREAQETFDAATATAK